ncbi:DNA polymerase beta superfamily protein [Nonomuraea sp. NEAU-A123]|uniref:nucleotidyltransferase domain-containing protein n=1 Tax=Nonomuraea sp. NEAU-A123 TaxID=2839649 RepID=UPI0027E169EA|nr:nucleotidyltransferase domain-containing protein [Nonomuraea sp. NEAU-A123]
MNLPTANLPAWLPEIPGEQPYPLVFATVSGAHLYGFPSADSDVDLRGVHVLPLREVVGLRTGPATLDRTWTRDRVEVDLVTHDLAKFCGLLLNRNGYVLEQLLSPLVVSSSALHEELTALAPGCLTRHHAHHYLGFARTQWRLFEKNGELKPLLYTFRVLATGIHLMRTGELDADLTHLFGYVPAYVPDLVAAKRDAEHGRAPAITAAGDDVASLTATLEAARDSSPLPEAATVRNAMHDLVVRARLATV